MPDAALLEAPLLGSTRAYREAGAGRPVLLLHGNPTSSFLWRHVLRRAAAGEHGGRRWIAPDLIGMGVSAQPDLAYRFADHALFVDAFLDALGLSDVVLVGHDWGVALAMDRLRRRPDDVRGLAALEGHLRPVLGWETFDEGGRRLFQQLRSPGTGERMVLEENFFLDTLLPAALLRPLTAEELAAYRRPHHDPAARRLAAAEHLRTTTAPTLLVHGDPGVLVAADTVAWCRRHLRDLTVTDVGGPAGHFLPEDRPDAVAAALLTWVQHLP